MQSVPLLLAVETGNRLRRSQMNHFQFWVGADRKASRLSSLANIVVLVCLQRFVKSANPIERQTADEQAAGRHVRRFPWSIGKLFIEPTTRHPSGIWWNAIMGTDDAGVRRFEQRCATFEPMGRRQTVGVQKS